LFELNADVGSTLVLVTHDDEVARRCQRVVHLHQGRLVENPPVEGKPDALSA
jgi:putative ABC transport system ATP-binding protein